MEDGDGFVHILHSLVSITLNGVYRINPLSAVPRSSPFQRVHTSCTAQPHQSLLDGSFRFVSVTCMIFIKMCKLSCILACSTIHTKQHVVLHSDKEL